MEHHSAENDQNQSSAGKYCQLHSLGKLRPRQLIEVTRVMMVTHPGTSKKKNPNYIFSNILKKSTC